MVNKNFSAHQKMKAVRSRRWTLVALFTGAMLLAFIFVFRAKDAAQQSSPGAAENLETQKKLNDSYSLTRGNLKENNEKKKDDSLQAENQPNKSFVEARLDEEKLLKQAVSSDVLIRNKALEDFKKRIVALESSGAGLGEVLHLFQGIRSEEDAFAPLIAAAGAVGSPAVQGVLRQLVTERNGDWRAFSAIIPVLGGLQSPTDDTLDFLARLAREGDSDFSSTAALALGSNVYTLSHTQPERGQRLLETYIAKIQNPQGDVEDLKESLAILGNAGLSATAPALLALTNHARADVRAEAVMALRFIRTPQVVERLIAVLRFDKDLDVRLNVIDALLHAPLDDDVQSVAQQLLSDSARTPSLLRSKCVDLLSHIELSGIKRADLQNWLLSQYKRETDENIKKKLLDTSQLFAPR